MDDCISPEHDRSALITIDVQRDFLDGQPLGVPGSSAALPCIARAADFFRQHGRPVVHVARIYLPDAKDVDLCRRAAVEGGSQILMAGSDGSQLAASLVPSPDVTLDVELLLSGGFQPLGPQEWIMYKPRWGAFYRTPLETHLRSLGVTTLVFAGFNFPNCPRTSVYEASERDLRLVVLEDAISGVYPIGLAELRSIGAWVVTTDIYTRTVD